MLQGVYDVLPRSRGKTRVFVVILLGFQVPGLCTTRGDGRIQRRSGVDHPAYDARSGIVRSTEDVLPIGRLDAGDGAFEDGIPASPELVREGSVVVVWMGELGGGGCRV